jgi:hypothetical protein
MMLGVCLSLPTPNAPKTRNFQAIIDSGASRCIFNASLAPELGLKLEDGDLQGAQGIGGSSQVWVHEVCIYVPDGDPVTTLAAFKENLPATGLLGMAGFFEHFLVTFDPRVQYFELKRIVPDQT